MIKTGLDQTYWSCMQMNYLQLSNELKKKKLHSLYLLYGNEGFFIKDVVDRIVDLALPTEEHDFNYSIYDMKETPVDAAVEEAETLPFFGEKRVILLKNSYFLTGSKRKEDVEHDVTKLEKYAEQPLSQTILIVTVNNEKLDERKKVVKKLKKQAVVMEASPFKEENMKEWLDDFIKETDVNITQNAKSRFIQLAGRDMNNLVSESQKLALFAAGGKEVNEDVVDTMIARTLEDNIFDLVDHVVNRRREKAFRVYFDLLKQNEEPIKILNLLARQFRIILHVLRLKQKGYSRQKMASKLKLHPYAVKIAEGQSAHFNERTLAGILSDLADADYAIKTGKIDKSLCLELNISKLVK
ncbi:DNA polymerase III subunit delta [Alteribacillus iranensis]|uniref:DNA polymerase III subunit delta n=1 Tax=Alteribacillus iranensis TaxID=930128 RepID=A0A1I1ZDG5_9BACI|nr:DNA polymerase III subunit delta [Alteribacillus iranensis]SFE28543.1 DNA polymerase III, delta subunit [Alteribacillus iranensis]